MNSTLSNMLRRFGGLFLSRLLKKSYQFRVFYIKVVAGSRSLKKALDIIHNSNSEASRFSNLIVVWINAAKSLWLLSTKKYDCNISSLCYIDHSKMLIPLYTSVSRGPSTTTPPQSVSLQFIQWDCAQDFYQCALYFKANPNLDFAYHDIEGFLW